MSQKEHKEHSHTIYGFLPYWVLGNAKYLQMDKLTDISYFSLHINKNGTIRKYTEEGLFDPGYTNWRESEILKNTIEAAKKQNVDFSVTILSHDGDISDYFLGCETCWDTLWSELNQELDYHGINSINLDFEYGGEVDKYYADQYTKLTGFLNNKIKTRNPDGKVVVSVFADSYIRDRVTVPHELAKVSDGIFIMAYDFHRPTSTTAGSISPISGGDVYHDFDLTQMIEEYKKHMTGEKIILGLPYYGYNWVVTSPEPYAERIPGEDEIGFSVSQTYEDVMDTILKYRPQILWDDVGKSPYFVYTNDETGSLRQAFFENTDSLKIKYELVKQNNFQGIGIWALGYDGGYQELWELLDETFMYSIENNALGY